LPKAIRLYTIESNDFYKPQCSGKGSSIRYSHHLYLLNCTQQDFEGGEAVNYCQAILSLVALRSKNKYSGFLFQKF